MCGPDANHRDGERAGGAVTREGRGLFPTPTPLLFPSQAQHICRSKTRDEEEDDMAGVLEPLAEDDAESVAGVAGVACSDIGGCGMGNMGPQVS